MHNFISSSYHHLTLAFTDSVSVLLNGFVVLVFPLSFLFVACVGLNWSQFLITHINKTQIDWLIDWLICCLHHPTICIFLISMCFFGINFPTHFVNLVLLSLLYSFRFTHIHTHTHTHTSSSFSLSPIILTSLYLTEGLAWWDWWTDQLLSFSALTLLVGLSDP